jgi:hypothetical protein
MIMKNKEEYSFGFPYDKKELIMENKVKLIGMAAMAEKYKKDWNLEPTITDFKVGDMVRCVDGTLKGIFTLDKVHEVEMKEGNRIKIKNSDYWWNKSSFELVSTIEKEPVYGDEIWVRDSEVQPWERVVYVDTVEGLFRVTKDNYEFKTGKNFEVNVVCYIRTTDPALDKTTLKLTLPQALQQLAEFKKVDSIEIINE